ncbi:diguanylate cyclase [bacterium]|nr:diguanylate cyclase [bacterium]
MKFEDYIIKQELEIYKKEIKKSSLELTLYKVLENSISDKLTGCFNRVKLMNILDYFQSEFISNGYSACVALIDIDFFKHINDNYGHSCGDYVLKTLGMELRSFYMKFFSIKNPLMIRWGGEEFLLFIPILESGNAKHFGKLLKDLVKNIDFNFRGQHIPVKISGGITFYGENDNIVDTIDRADAALYFSKHNGRDRISMYHDIELRCTVKEIGSGQIVEVDQNYPVEIDATFRFEFFDVMRKKGKESMMSKGTGRLAQHLKENKGMLFELLEFDERWNLNIGDYFVFKPENNYRKHFLFETLSKYFGSNITLLHHSGDCKIFSPEFKHITGNYYYVIDGKSSGKEYQNDGFKFFIFDNFNERQLFYFIAVTRFSYQKLFNVKNLSKKNMELLLRLLFKEKNHALLKSGMELYKDIICTNFVKGLLFAISRKFDQALEFLRKAPQNDDVLGNIAGCLIRLEKYDEAEKILIKALKVVEPKWKNNIFEHLFYLHFKKNNIAGMKKVLKEFKLPVSIAKSCLNISDYYLKLGKTSEMNKYLEKAKKIDPFLIDRVFNKKYNHNPNLRPSRRMTK